MRAGLVAIGCALALGSAGAQEARSDMSALFSRGQDFCFGRAYDAAHLARNPRQTVTAIYLGGRNAQRVAGEARSSGSTRPSDPGPVYVALHVRFRDDTRTWSGVCRQENPGAVGCKILPHRNRDSIDQGLTLRAAGTGVTIEAAGDWAYFRSAVDGDGGGDVRPDDRLFRVSRLPLRACSLSPAHWSADGATAKFLADFP